MKKIILFIKILFKRKDLSEDDMVNAWLIPCFFTTLEELTPLYENVEDKSRAFHKDHEVKKFVHRIWRIWAIHKVRNSKTRWFLERRFPFISRYKPSLKYIKHGFWTIDLQCSPSIIEL